MADAHLSLKVYGLRKGYWMYKEFVKRWDKYIERLQRHIKKIEELEKMEK